MISSRIERKCSYYSFRICECWVTSFFNCASPIETDRHPHRVTSAVVHSTTKESFIFRQELADFFLSHFFHPFYPQTFSDIFPGERPQTNNRKTQKKI